MTGERGAVGAVRFPATYGTVGGAESRLQWSWVEQRIRAASNYWITTVGPDARPQYFSGAETPFRPFWALRPTKAFAWTLAGFPRDATCWRLAEPSS